MSSYNWHDSTPVTSRVRHKTLCNMRQVHDRFPALLPLVRVYREISFQGILSKHRPMNNMKLHFDLPQEDELGTNLLSGLRVSPNRLIFMKDEMECRKYQCLKEGEVSERELGSWIRSFQKLIWKIKLRDALNQKDRKMPR